jgi:hypothetical protein
VNWLRNPRRSKTDRAAILRVLSQHQGQQLSLLDAKLHTVLADIQETQAQTLAAPDMEAFSERVMTHFETVFARHVVVSLAASETRWIESRGTKRVLPAGASANVVLLSGAGVSRKQVARGKNGPETGGSETAENEVDKMVWPLLNAGKKVRGIASETGVKKATVGRSRLRWTAARRVVSVSSNETVMNFY